MGTATNIASDGLRGLHTQLRAFVSKTENSALLRGTADYSVLFRGTVFGHDRMDEVQSALTSGRRVDVLWLGANPNAPESIKAILDGSASDATPAPGAAFDRQIDYGFLGHTTPDGRSWDPLNNPPGPWKIYRDALQLSGVAASTLMANVIPWGSANMGSLIRPLHEMDPALTSRALQFVDELNAQLVEIVRPRLLVLPLSIADNAAIRKIAPTFGLLFDSMEHREELRVPTNGQSRKRCLVGLVRRGSRTVPAVVLPHPSAWRCKIEERSTLIQEVASVVNQAVRKSLFPTPTPRRIPASKQRRDRRERRATRVVAVVGGDHALTVYAP